MMRVYEGINLLADNIKQILSDSRLIGEQYNIKFRVRSSILLEMMVGFMLDPSEFYINDELGKHCVTSAIGSACIAITTNKNC